MKESFYADLIHHTSKIDEKEIIILGGDLNGHVGERQHQVMTMFMVVLGMSKECR